LEIEADLDVGTEKTLTENAYRRLRRDIIAGLRPAGERLRIERLRGIYGIGPSPLREALQRLAGDGLVIIEGQRGFEVAPLTAEELMDITEARKLIETRAIALSIEKGDDTWEAGVVAAAYRLDKADRHLKAGDMADIGEWEARNRDFHDSIVQACGSKWLIKLRNMLYDQHERYRRASVADKSGERDLSAEHAAIRDAVLRRDPALACRLTVEHIDMTTQDFLSSALHVGEAKARR
jgi:GntR family carbon starvation induced transcriptional regulator